MTQLIKPLFKLVAACLTLLVFLFLVAQIVAIQALNHTIEQSQKADVPKLFPLSTPSKSQGVQPVIFVGNNWQGTITVIDGKTYQKLGVIDGIPDKVERLEAIKDDVIGRILYLGIRHFVGEGNDQYVDDMYSSLDGERLIVSRPSFADVVAIHIKTGEIIWRFPVAGYRSDHMALSPDGKQVAVSASTGDLVHLIDIDTGVEVGRFEAGDSPHENLYSKDGSKIYHSSIGHVFSPLDIKGGGLLKGNRRFIVASTEDFSVIESFDIKTKLEEAGYKELSPSIRPMAHTQDERLFYFQLSFLHGFVEYDMQSKEITRKVDLPRHTKLPKTQYVNDSAHHGIAISGDDQTLCVAGTMDDYVALVDIASLDYKLLTDLGEKPYWAVTNKTGEHCLISWSETDQMSVVDYQTGEEVARIDVGDHPQRVREGFLAL